MIERLIGNIERVFVGKGEVVRLAVAGLLSEGHLLIDDIPGIGKTTLAVSLARSIGCEFQRIQCTSDLLPSDILGVSIYQPAHGNFEFKPGPIFHHIILADEINRATPKTQSALLEAMNERQVTIDGKTYPLPRPFLIFATQNPYEHHGTYPLPESQLDRFLIRLRIGYPAVEDERRILQQALDVKTAERLEPVLTREELLQLIESAARVRVDAAIDDYILALAGETRRSPFVTVGVSPRGALALRRASQAWALIAGRDYLVPDDCKMLAAPVLAHRLLTPAGNSGSANQHAEEIIRELLDRVAVPL